MLKLGLLLGLALVPCGAPLACPDLQLSKPAPAPATMTLSEKDAGRNVALKVGQLLEVRLESNPTTGFEWFVAQALEALPAEGKPEFIAPNTDSQGARGVQVWRFKAAKAGKVTLELHYLRSWEKVAPLKKWSAVVEIK